MFKGLLYVCLTLFSINCCSQTTLTDITSPSELTLEDPNHTITDLSYTSTESAKVILSWKVNGHNPDFFSIERSNNGKSYETVSVLNNQQAEASYQWTDDDPAKGRNFYRIRYSFKEGQSLYSKSVSVLIAGYLSFKFYPNPVDHILIVRANSPLDVQITDANGKVRVSELRVLGLRTVNVSSLEKGIYLIRFSNKLMNIMSQEKLIKN
ncbi:MAG: T9SS type A sorting domain-containing protein [Flavitalea sp.]